MRHFLERVLTLLTKFARRVSEIGALKYAQKEEILAFLLVQSHLGLGGEHHLLANQFAAKAIYSISMKPAINYDVDSKAPCLINRLIRGYVWSSFLLHSVH